MTIRRGSQYSIQSDVGGLRRRGDLSKGKRKGKIPSGTESTQATAISRRQVPDMAMIFETWLERMYKDRYLEMLPQIHQGVMNSWNILRKFLKEEEIVRYSNGWNPLSSKPAKKREERKEEAPVSSTSKPQANQLPQEGKNKKKNWRKPYSPSYKIPKNPKRCHGKCLQHDQNLDGIQGQ
ncbi:hypothetical protein O181_038753 [Austropuccinia psidii MF-1]|uniref:Uncharacterized protein n=1 Tax=Austropuccinia psidii MF-1 TaxID=1389203 RepID=A0A9Q3DC11_9BASI|nr:hypothetical protein [Austropuccinia psidii MF-1]